MATLTLRFDPHDSSSEPPRLGGLTTKIKATTHFAARPASSFPNKLQSALQFESTRGTYSTTIPLSSRCVESVTWTRREPNSAAERRNSDSSSSSSDFSDSAHSPESKESAPYYSATILVPITLPGTKAWSPTFHSCLTSRTYTLDLSLGIHTPGTGMPASSVALHLPVQIAALGNQNERTPLTDAEQAAELADANEFLRPRVIEVPREEHVGNSRLAAAAPSDMPPSYEDFLRPVVEPGRS